MKIKNILLLLGAMACVTSCDMTDLNPLDSLSDANYWKTLDDLDKYSKGFYTNLSAPSNTLDETSDDRVTSTYNTWLFNEWVTPTTASDAGWSWENIRNLNFFMTHYERVEEGTEADINRYVGVIRFFRALDYYGKIKKFGDVPWYDKDLTTDDTEELYKARDSYDFVLNKVIEDLEFAITWLPDKTSVESGELHKDAARTLLSRVCLYYGTYKKYHNKTGSPTSEELLRKAASVSLEVMNSGRYAIVKGDNAGCGQSPFEGYSLYYSNQFTQEDLTTNAECILARVYVSDLLTNNIGRATGAGLSKDFAESFLCKDGLPIANSSLYKGDETIDQEIENRDPRMYQLIDNVHKPYYVLSDGTRQVNYSLYDINASMPSVDASGSVTGFDCVKYHPADPAQFEANKTTFDWFVFRYAEILLNYAEAKAELGECTQQVLDQTINLLRDRVGMPHLTISPAQDAKPLDYGYTLSPLLYEIRRERRIEMVNEGIRYDDVMRWNAVKLYENPKTFLGIRVTDKVISLYEEGTFGGTSGRALIDYDGKTYLRPYNSKSLNEAGRKWETNDKRYLYPLPTEEIVLNPNLTQNPGWRE